MRFYKQQHQFYCGIDLHAKTMHVCLVDQAGEILVHQNLKTQPDRFFGAISPYQRTKPSGRRRVHVLWIV